MLQTVHRYYYEFMVNFYTQVFIHEKDILAILIVSLISMTFASIRFENSNNLTIKFSAIAR